MSQPKSSNEVAVEILEKLGIEKIIKNKFMIKRTTSSTSYYEFENEEQFEKALDFYLEKLRKVLNTLD